MTTPREALESIWTDAGGDPTALGRVTLTGADPMLPTDVKIGTAATAVAGAIALAAAELWQLRGGRPQSVAVDMRAAVAAFRSERYLRVDGAPVRDPRSPLFGFYPTRDDRWIQIHANLPHHHAGHVKFLGCDDTRESMAAAVSRWKATDLTRVIAGPECGRQLASHGADVLLVTSPHLPTLPSHVIDFGFGKRATSLDLRRAEDADRLRSLIAEADVFSQGYRPGALARLGFGLEEVARLRSGIVYVTLSAYGRVGPWRDRRGFETLIQSVSGLAHEHGFGGGMGRPHHLPAQVVDHATGYLAGFGALIALARRAQEGGSYLVTVSLAQTGRWVDALGRVAGRAVADQNPADVADLLEECDSEFGRLRYVRPAARLSETPSSWSRSPVPVGTHEPTWVTSGENG